MVFAIPARALWEKLAEKRKGILERAEDCASLTLPYTFPRSGLMPGQEVADPYQSVGSRGVNNLAAKFILSLLPPNSPFFRLDINEADAAEQFGNVDPGELEQFLVSMENEIQLEIELLALRPLAFATFRDLVIGGNRLLSIPNRGPVRSWSLRDYCVDRDPQDTVMQLIIREEIALLALPPAIQDFVRANPQYQNASTVEIFTRAERMEDGRYFGAQQVLDQIIPGTEGTWQESQFPYLPLRLYLTPGEDYGHGHVEQHFGDLRSLEGLVQSIVEYAAMASHVTWLFDPNGATRIRDIKGAPNGAHRPGREQDVGAMRLDKHADIQTAVTTMQATRADLELAFLLNTSVRRDAERVTAEEIRYIAQELEESLGGVFSAMSQEFQAPLVKRLIERMIREGTLPRLKKDLVQPRIITGLEGIGRGQELQKLMASMSGLQQFLGPEEVKRVMDTREVVNRFLNGGGVSAQGLILSPEEIAQNDQQAMMAQLVSTLGPEGMKQFGALLKQPA